MKFLIDMPLSPAVAERLVEKGHSAVHAYSIGLGKADDAEILRRAGEEGRIVVTCDLDFPRLLALAEAKGPSLILLRGGSYGEAAVLETLERILKSIPGEDMIHCVLVADKARLRLHRLPLKPS